MPEREKSDKLKNFTYDFAKMVRLLALYFGIFFVMTFLVAVLQPGYPASSYLSILTFLLCGGITFLFLPKDHKKFGVYFPKPNASGAEASEDALPERAGAGRSALVALGIILFALGITIWFNYGFAKVPWDLFLPKEAQYSSESAFRIPLIVSLIGYGIISPFAEEVAFRGILNTYFAKWMKPWIAILLSSLFFAFYHGNVIQGCYAFAMGACMAFICYRTGSLYSSMIFHMTANLLVTLYANLPDFYDVILSIPGMIAFAVFGIAGAVIFILTTGKSGKKDSNNNGAGNTAKSGKDVFGGNINE